MRQCTVLIYHARSRSSRELNQQRGQTFAPSDIAPWLGLGLRVTRLQFKLTVGINSVKVKGLG